MAIFRWWLAANLAASGLALAIHSITEPLDVRPSWFLRRAIAVILGAAMLSFAYFLAIRFRCRSEAALQAQFPMDSKQKDLLCVVDGFLVFSIGSFLLNLFLVLFRGYDLDPTFDLLHHIPTVLVTNTIWEALIHRTGGSLILNFSTVVAFDGLLGGLVGIILSPLRVIPRIRIVVLVLHFVLFCWFEFLMFRC